MSSVVVIIALAFCTHRVTHFIVDDTLFDRPRIWLHRTVLGTVPSGWRFKILEGLQCTWCTSVWVGFAAAGVAIPAAGISFWEALVLPLAFSSATIAIDRG